jgi:selenocysteine lyase/cysteine desulfurase
MTLVHKSGFGILPGQTYLDTAAEGLLPASAQEALDAYRRDKSRGTPGRERMFEEERACKDGVARLLGARAEDIALLSSASEGLNLLVNSIDWRPGDEFVTTDLEFPSAVFACLRLQRHGVRVRVVSSDAGVVTGDQLCAAIGPTTRLVVLSQVSYKSGTNLDSVPEVAAEAHRVGALVCVDATQALCRVAVPLDGVDFLVSSSYKWLLGIHGVGVVYWAPESRERLQPAAAGWYSSADLFAADRFTVYRPKPGAAQLMTGMPNFAAVYVLRRSVALLCEVGIAAIERQLAPLVAALRDGFARLGLTLLTPCGPLGASGIVSFAHSDCEALGAALEREGIIVWRGDGRVRASIHLYNERADVETLLSALAQILNTEVTGSWTKA